MFLHGCRWRAGGALKIAAGDKLYLRETDFIRGAARRARARKAGRRRRAAAPRTSKWQAPKQEIEGCTTLDRAAGGRAGNQPAKLTRAGAPLRAAATGAGAAPRGRRAISSADRWRWAAQASSRWQAWNCIGAAGSSR